MHSVYQNRNVVLSNTPLSFAKNHNKTIIQKILEKGHTQMEVDSVHAKVEAKLIPKTKAIYVPADYVDVITAARKLPEPYQVKYLSYNFFKDYTKVGNLKSIRPGTRAGDPTVSNLRALKYSPNGELWFKLRHTDTWTTLEVPRRSRTESYDYQAATPLYTSR